MEWMWAAFWAWFGWNILAPLAFGAVVLLVVGLCMIPGVVRQARCEHQRFRETMACDAICNDCGKNLGFIGAVRDQRSIAAATRRT